MLDVLFYMANAFAVIGLDLTNQIWDNMHPILFGEENLEPKYMCSYVIIISYFFFVVI